MLPRFKIKARQSMHGAKFSTIWLLTWSILYEIWAKSRTPRLIYW